MKDQKTEAKTGTAEPVASTDLFAVDSEPKPDIACCSNCGWRGSTDIYVTRNETGSDYYPADICPYCEDGGCVDDYDMTPKRAEEWNLWKSAANSLPCDSVTTGAVT
jgi:hypothetical protein